MKLFPHIILSISLLAGCGSDQALVYEKVVEVPVEVEVVVEVPVEVETPIEEADIWIDSFVQVSAVDGVDIIWVIDTSGSMQQFQDRLLVGIEQMMLSLPPTGWRLIMIPTDPEEAEVEQQFPLVPGDTITDAEDMYAAMGTGADEEGFDALYHYMQYNPYAASWMRHDAALLVVFVSDEDDQSTTFATANEFVMWYTSRRFGNVFLASIVMQEEDQSVCEVPVGSSDVGTRYMGATDLMFGTIVDICSEDWTPGVSAATDQIEPYESITLSYTPIEQTIRVFVDGSEYLNWMFDAATNTVFFTVIPNGGALVEVGYVVSS